MGPGISYSERYYQPHIPYQPCRQCRGPTRTVTPLAHPIDVRVSNLSDTYFKNMTAKEPGLAFTFGGVWVTFSIFTLGQVYLSVIPALLVLGLGVLMNDDQKRKEVISFLVNEYLSNNPGAVDQEIFDYVSGENPKFYPYTCPEHVIEEYCD